MKVVDLTEFYSERGGGVRSHLALKGHVLCQRGVRHRVIAPGPRNERSLGGLAGGRYEDADAPWVYRIKGPALPYDPTYHLFARVDKIRALALALEPDVLEINSPYFAAAAALAIARSDVPVRTFFWHADFIDTYLRAPVESRVGTRVADITLGPLWAYVRAIAARCDATIVASRYQLGKLQEHRVQRVVHVPFGVEKGVFSPAARSEARRSELLGDVSEGAALLVAVGRFAVEKRWDVVLDAFFRFRQEHDAVLALFGDGPERAAMEARCRGRSDVRFFGFERDRSRLASAFASADALVHGCPYETFGLGVAEAIACGLPAVVPDQGGAAESASPESAELYPSLDANACAQAIARLLGRDRETLRRAALASAACIPRVEDHFDGMIALYNHLLERA